MKAWEILNKVAVAKEQDVELHIYNRETKEREVIYITKTCYITTEGKKEYPYSTKVEAIGFFGNTIIINCSL